MNQRNDHADIRIGTLVNGLKPDPADYIRQILPHGFESFSITFWQTLGEVQLPRLAREVRSALTGSGATVSSLSVFGNPLGTAEIDELSREGWRACIDHAADFGAGIVTGFAGRVVGKPVEESIPRFREVFTPLAERAAARNVRIAFENCPMGGSWASGDWNIAFAPRAWKLMFDAVPAANLGLQWEPCHQLCQLIDPIAQLREWAPRVFLVHGKDASVYHDVIRAHGILGPEAWCHHRHPGFGDSDWTAIISILRLAGFRGAIDIEGWHDPVYRAELEMTGQVHALNYLKRCRGGAFAANPVERELARTQARGA